MAYRGVLLDFYGTIVHEDDHIIADICQQILAASITAESEREIANQWWASFCELMESSHGEAFLPQRQIAQKSLSDTIRQFGAELDPAPLIERQLAHWRKPGIFDDSRGFLQFLNQTGMPVCIVSNIDRVDLEAAIAYHGFEFPHIITSDDMRAYKPRPEMISAALSRLHLASDEVLHIGDSRTSDVAGARALGISVAWVNRTEKQSLSGPQPTYEVSSLNQIPQYLV